MITDPEDGERTIRAKWVIDEAKTLGEAAARVRQFADNLEAMEAEGWQLVDIIYDDYGFATRKK